MAEFHEYCADNGALSVKSSAQWIEALLVTVKNLAMLSLSTPLTHGAASMQTAVKVYR